MSTPATKTNTATDNNSANSWLDAVTFTSDGLVPAIAQDKETGEILMMAWMNRESLQLTAETKTAVYFSRSRGKLWHKGETSGHTQIVHDLYLDCDADVIVLSVTQIGDIACHTGRKSCFYRKLDLSGAMPEWQVDAPVLKDPDAIYGYNTESKNVGNIETAASEPVDSHQTDALDAIDAATILQHLDTVLAERKQADADTSYVASLYAKGINKILEKVGEEAVETIIAAKDLAAADSQTEPTEKQPLIDDLVYEIADVWFHTVVTLAWFNIGSERVLAELARRFGLSGIEEKNSRTQ